MIGQRISNYVITSILGEGGMGTVYAAEHEVIGRKVAIKVLQPELAHSELVVGRFFNEARAASLIHHRGIVEVIDVGRLRDRRPYLIMELLVGQTLSAATAKKPVPVDTALRIGCEVAAAVGAAHDKGIVHRDLKPDNIFLVDAPDGSLRVKVLDFGIAKLRDDLPHTKVETHTGSLVGTPSYMSPEQCRGVSKDIDHRTDIYSLGVVLYKLIAGRLPFDAAASGELMVAHMRDRPPPLRNVLPGLPDAVEEAVMRALAKDARDRYATMFEFESALANARAFVRPEVIELGGRMSRTLATERDRQTTLSASSGVRARARGSRRRGLAVLVGIGTVAGLAALALMVPGRRAPDAPGAVPVSGSSAAQPGAAVTAPAVPPPVAVPVVEPEAKPLLPPPESEAPPGIAAPADAPERRAADKARANKPNKPNGSKKRKPKMEAW